MSGPAIPGGPAGTRCDCSRLRTSTHCPVYGSQDRRVALRQRMRWPTTSRPTPPDLIFLFKGICASTPSPGTTDRFVVITGQDRFEADNVVLATGGYQAAFVPDFASELDAGIVQLHSSDYRRPSQLRDGDVLVVGAANSGAEIALEASATHRTWLSGRHPGNEPTRPGTMVDRLFTPPFWFFLSRVASVTNPIGRRLRPKMLKETLPLGRVKLKDLDAAGVVRLPQDDRGERRCARHGGRTGHRCG